jgi:hypothetical protein
MCGVSQLFRTDGTHAAPIRAARFWFNSHETSAWRMRQVPPTLFSSRSFASEITGGSVSVRLIRRNRHIQAQLIAVADRPRRFEATTQSRHKLSIVTGHGWLNDNPHYVRLGVFYHRV